MEQTHVPARDPSKSPIASLQRALSTEVRASLEAVREAREAYYKEQGIEPPASTAVGVAGLAVEGALIEIEAYAVLP